MMDLGERLPAEPSLTDQSLVDHQIAVWMALQDAETSLNYLAEKLLDPYVTQALHHVKEAARLSKEIQI